jgi:hypothetical protein
MLLRTFCRRHRSAAQGFPPSSRAPADSDHYQGNFKRLQRRTLCHYGEVQIAEPWFGAIRVVSAVVAQGLPRSGYTMYNRFAVKPRTKDAP